MSKCQTYLFVLILVVSALTTGWGQVGKKECLDLVKAYNLEMKKLGKPVNGKTYFVDFQQEVSYWDGTRSGQNQRIKYYITNNQVHLITDDICTYINTEYVFTVIQSQKKIIVTRNPESDEDFDNSMLNTFLKNQAYVIDQSPVSECSEVQDKGLTKVVLDATKVKVNGLNADKLTYFFDTGSGKLKKTITTYDRGYEIRRMSITYYNFSTNYKYNFPKDLVGMFLDDSGNLKAKYRGYELIAN